MKTCSKCKLSKEEINFYKHAQGRGGLNPRCIPCVRDVAKIIRVRDFKRNADRVCRWRKENPERYKVNQKKGSLKRIYGISLEEYTKMVDTQNNCCAICSQAMTPKVCIDHCHITGKIRALLCQKCNTGIGMFNDSLQLCVLAVRYLKKYATPQ